VKRTSFIALAFLVSVGLTGMGAVEATQVSAPFVTVAVGDVFTISIAVSDAADLTSWQLDLSFDPAVVAAGAVTEGPFLAGFGATLFTAGVVDSTTGLVSLVADAFVDLPPDPSGSGILATIEFTALAVGVSPLTLSSVFLNLVDEGFDIANGQITVLDAGDGTGGGGGGTVPAPATLALLATGTGMLGLRRPITRALAGVALGLVALVVVGFPAASAEAQTVAPGPYYAMPSWDQTLPASTRFVVLSNMRGEAVLDRETGLVWERSPLSPCTNPLFCVTLDSGQRSWRQAHDRCRRLTTGHRGGWRLPGVQELASLVDFDPANTSQPKLPFGHPFIGVQPAAYWSATTVDQMDENLYEIPVAAYLVVLGGNGGLGEAV
jgi:hypothetical protein